MHPPHRQSVAQISEELGIRVMTLYKWRQAWRLHREGAVIREGARGLERCQQIHGGAGELRTQRHRAK